MVNLLIEVTTIRSLQVAASVCMCHRKQKDLLAFWVTNLDEPLDSQTLRNLEGDRMKLYDENFWDHL